MAARSTSTALRTAALLLLVSCGGGQDGARSPSPAAPPPAPSLPASALADAARCDLRTEAQGAVGYTRDGGDCLRSFSGLGTLAETAAAAAPGAGDAADGRKRALATRTVSATEVFNWAETTFPQYFPSRRQTITLDPYVYRYYPESQNHIAIAGERVYVQGGSTGGQLLFVGTLADLTCGVDPSACSTADCTPPPQWTSGANVCSPDAGQPPTVVNGATFTYRDNTAPAVGSVTYTCNGGRLATQGNVVCDQVAQRSCDTSALAWTVGSATCSPNSNEPTQIASGVTYTFTDSVGTTGRAGYSCNNGTLTKTGTDTCNPAPPTACVPTPGSVSWSEGGETCTPDSLPASIADGANQFFIDTFGDYTGSKVFRCTGGLLTPISGGTCALMPLVHDSFGDVAGGADGGASGDGTAGDGAPIVGGLVRVIDVNGKVANGLAPTDARGYYRVNLTGMVPPLVVSVQRSDGKFRRSLSTQPLRRNGFIFMSVTGLTDKIVSDMAKAAGFSGPSQLTPQMIVNLGPQKLNDVIVALRNDTTVRNQLIGAGINPDTFDPLATPFRADGTGYDKVLDNIVVGTDASGGTTISPIGGVPPPPATQCSLPGTASWNSGTFMCNSPPVAGTITVNVGQTITFTDNNSPTFGTLQYLCTTGGVLVQTILTCGFSP